MTSFLGHCVPFKTIIIAADAASAKGVPLVQLPHVHIDDEFYHWSSYFAALRKADLCITHPKASTPLFFDRIGARSWYLPPGIEIGAQPSDNDRRIFHDLYESQLPFVLILGRKDRTKNYLSTISAVDRLNKGKRRCNVVMIGRDEDGEALDPMKAIYLGPQPKGIVLAALQRSLCLVSMSESESFGIVILEAWAQGRPAIVSDRCVASVELLNDGHDGLHANVLNLHEKILLLLDNTDETLRMGENGQK